MRLFFKSKDGGPNSNVIGYWLIEAKHIFSIVLLRFDKGSREAYHDHAFNSWSWVLSGGLLEETLKGPKKSLIPSISPIYVSRNRFHKVHGITEKTWVLSFRGPWKEYWHEYTDKGYTTLTNGRKIVNENSHY